MRADLSDLFVQSGGVVRRADHPELAQRLDRLRRNRELGSPLPGILTSVPAGTNFDADVLAGQLWAGPDAVLTAKAAARFTFWPDSAVDQFPFAVPRRHKRTHGRWSQSYRPIPPEHVWHRGPIAFTDPAMTAVDLATGNDGGDVIDRALRSRQVSLEDLWAALKAQPRRPGNAARKALLVDSRDSPWSEGERDLHRLLRRAGLTGWETNAWIPVGAHGYYADVLFRRARLIAEFDGREFHTDRNAFDDDRYRRNELVLAGYTVLNFTWTHLCEHRAWVIDCLNQALA